MLMATGQVFMAMNHIIAILGDVMMYDICSIHMGL